MMALRISIVVELPCLPECPTWLTIAIPYIRLPIKACTVAPITRILILIELTNNLKSSSEYLSTSYEYFMSISLVEPFSESNLPPRVS